MTGVMTFYRTSIGKKVVMALTGLFMIVFVVGHMVGNLKIYLPDNGAHINHYGEFLRTMGEPLLVEMQALWMFRIVMIAALVLHVLSAFQLWGAAQSARSSGYTQKKSSAAVYTAQMMRLGGIAIGLFIILHVLHLTIGLHPNFIHGEVYHNVITGFQNPLVSVGYIAAMVALGLHIFHGGWSMFQTVGLNNRDWKMTWRTIAALIATAVMIGNISIPIAVLAGILSL